LNYDGHTSNVLAIGFQKDGKWMYSGEGCGENHCHYSATLYIHDDYYCFCDRYCHFVLHCEKPVRVIWNAFGIAVKLFTTLTPTTVTTTMTTTTTATFTATTTTTTTYHCDYLHYHYQHYNSLRGRHHQDLGPPCTGLSA